MPKLLLPRSGEQKSSFQLFVLLLRELVKSHKDLTATTYPENMAGKLRDGNVFDFIVVGAGTAGSIVASRISENPKWSVLLLEAGTLPSEDCEIPYTYPAIMGTDEDWSFKTEPLASEYFKNNSFNWPMGKVLGGTSSINSMNYNRANRKDFELWTGPGMQAWDSNTARNYYKKIENITAYRKKQAAIYGMSGNLRLTKYICRQPIVDILEAAASELMMPTTADQQAIGYYNCYNIIDRGERKNSAKAYIGDINSQRENLNLALKSYVTKIIVDHKTKTAKGVEMQVEGGNVISIFAVNEVIICAGTVKSPQLLMLSGIGPEQHLKSLGIEIVKDLPVGSNLMDHILFPGFIVKLNTNAVEEFRHKLLDEIYKYYIYRRGVFSTAGLSNFLGYIDTGHTNIHPTIQINHRLYLENDHSILPATLEGMNLNESLIDFVKAANKTQSLLHMMPLLLNPNSKGRIELRDTDPKSTPKIFPNFFSDTDAQDLDVFWNSVRYLLKITKTQSMRNATDGVLPLSIGPLNGEKFDTEAYWKRSIKLLCTTGWCQVGTCKMGAETNKAAVVCPRMNVIGVKNLRVVDASIFPEHVTVGPMGTVMMIAEYASDLIKEDNNVTDSSDNEPS